MKIPNWLLNIILEKMGVIGMFKQIQSFLVGKKTYLLAAAGVIGASVKFAGDGNVAEFLTAIWGCLTSCTIRSAVG